MLTPPRLGRYEEDKKDEIMEEEPEPPESVDAFVEEEEKEPEPIEEVSEHPGSAEAQAEPVEDQEPIESVPQPPEQEPISEWNEKEKTEIGSSDEKGKPKADPILSRQVLSLPMEVPNDKVGVLFGKSGANAEGLPSLGPLGFNAGQAARGFEQVEILVPNEKVKLITGMAGETMRNMMIRSGALIKLKQPHPSDIKQSKECFVRITGNKKQMMSAKEMIKNVLNQTVRQSPISSESIQQQGHRPRRPVAPLWGSRGGSHLSKFSCYKYPQRAPLSYPSQDSQNTPSYNGNYPPPVAPRSHAQPYGQQPRPNQPVEAPKQGPAQTYGQSSPSSQQQYTYAPSGPMQQTYPYPPYGSAPASAGYGQTYPNNPPAASSSGYGQPVAGYGQQPGVQQQPQEYPQAGYGLFLAPQPAVYAEQQQWAANNAAAYWYQAPVDPAAYGAPPQQGPPAAAYPVAAAFSAQPTQAHHPWFYQSGGYGSGGYGGPQQ